MKTQILLFLLFVSTGLFAQLPYSNTVQMGSAASTQEENGISFSWTVGSFAVLPGEGGASERSAEAENQTAESLQVRLAPNPAADRTTVFISAPQEERFNYALYNPIGQLVKSGRTHGKNHSLKLDGLPAGLYHLQISNSLDQSVSVRLLKVKE
jgi:hypothetical protein